MKLGDMLCPWHPTMTLFECKPLHEAVTDCPDCPHKMHSGRMCGFALTKTFYDYGGDDILIGTCKCGQDT